MTQPVISYGYWRDGLLGYGSLLRLLIDEHRARSVCDVGGGAAAALTPAEVAARGLDYTLLDISQAELDKSPDAYGKIHADICAVDVAARVGRRFDLIQSHMLAEHVARPAAFHRNVFELLEPGGIAVHMMPTLWDPAFIANRLLPERLAHRILAVIQPWRRLHADQGKFPAYYRWCRGPSKRHLSRFESIGYEVVEVRGYFGTGYTKPVPGVNALFEKITAAFIRRPRPSLTSYAVLILRRPLARDAHVATAG